MNRQQDPRPSGRVRGSYRRAVLCLLFALSLAAGALAGEAGVVNINTASVSELARLPGIGESKAGAIVAARKARGSFRRPEDLLEVKGIGEAALAKIRQQIVLQGKTTLSD